MNVLSPYGIPSLREATSAVNGFPTGLGPVSRTIPVGGWWSDLVGGVSPAVVDIGKQFIQSQAVRGIILAKQASGYTNLGPVIVDGKPYVKMKNPQGIPVLIDETGRETAVTAETQVREQRIDASGNVVAGTAVGIGVGFAVVVIGLALFLRRK